jgi:glycosyltransferase involved in cell wall biosynthesis
VISSNVASLKEVGGDAVLYFDPLDTRMLADQMNQLITSPAICNSLRQKGIEQARKFSWRTAALDTWQTLRKLL